MSRQRSDQSAIGHLSKGIYQLEIYCDNNRDDCPAREAYINLKIYGNSTRESRLLRSQLKCPLCGCASKLHAILTSSDRATKDLSNAISVVNSALFARDFCDKGDLVVLPVNVFCLDQLPSEWRCIGWPRG
jgi:hypothetical protein